MLKRIVLNLLGIICGLLVFSFGIGALSMLTMRGLGDTRSHQVTLLEALRMASIPALIAVASAIGLRYIVRTLRRDRGERPVEPRGFPVEPINPEQSSERGPSKE